MMNNKELLFKNFSSIDIPEEVLESSYKKLKHIKDSQELSNKFNRLVEKYIVNEIKNDNIDIQIQVIENYGRLKKMILMNPKYNYDSETIKNAYEEAIELLKERCDTSKSLYNNILENMKFILNKSNNKPLPKEEVLYDISFMKEYVSLYKVEESLCGVLKCDKDSLNMLLDGNKKLNEKQISLIYNMFNVNNYELLKKNVNKKIEIVKNMMKKIDEKHLKDKYDLSFMKEFVELYDYDINKLSRLWKCGIKVVPKILDGQIELNDSLLWETYSEFQVKDYNELKGKINKFIKNKKTNIIKEDIKQEVKVINIESLNKEKLFELLDEKNITYKDYLITILLFSDITDRTIEEISDFLYISKSYVLKVYINDLEIIKNKFKKNNKTIKLIHKNEEVD